MSEQLITEGLGWKWLPQERELIFILEADFAQTNDGLPVPAGTLVRLGGIKELPPLDKIRDTVDNFAANGIEVPGFGKMPCRVLTWADYVARGYNDEEGGAK